MRSYWGIEGIASRTLILGTSWRWVGQLHAPAALFTGKGRSVPIR